MVSRTLRLAREFLFPESVRQRNIAALDAGLSPNDDLELMDELLGGLDPDDVAFVDEAVLVSAGDAVLRIEAGGAIRPYATLPAPAGAMAVDPEGGLLVCVAGRGLVRVHGDGQLEEVATELDGAALACLTAVTVTPSGQIFVTEGSVHNGVDEWARDLLEQRRAGRLLEIDRGSGAVRVLHNGLGWPHGVCAAADDTSLVVTECWEHRVLTVDPDGRGVDVLLDDLPGYPGRITPSADSGYWLGFLSLRSHLVELVLREDAYRIEMMAGIDPEYWIRPALRTTTEPWQPLQIGQMKHLGVTKPWAPPRSYGLVAHLAADGTPIASLHSRAGGTRHATLTAREHDGRLHIVSRGGRSLLTRRVQR